MIDRRVVTTDNGGISEKMILDFDEDLVLNFEVQSYEHSKRAEILRQTKLSEPLAFQSQEFTRIDKAQHDSFDKRQMLAK